MNVFAAVYTSAHPHQAPALFQYIETVRRLRIEGGYWEYYDNHYRLQRERNPKGYPWDHISWLLWDSAKSRLKVAMAPFLNSRETKQVSHPQSQYNHPSTFKKPVQRCPPGYCFIYHGGKTCHNDPCRFNHSCYKCNKPHPGISCSSKTPAPTSHNPSSTQKRRTATQSNSSSNPNKS